MESDTIRFIKVPSGAIYEINDRRVDAILGIIGSITADNCVFIGGVYDPDVPVNFIGGNNTP